MAVVPTIPTSIPARLGIVLDALDRGVDTATLPREITRGFNLPLLRALPRSVREELAGNSR
jgi:hypothetical protein